MTTTKRALAGALLLAGAAVGAAAQTAPLGTPIPRKPLGQAVEGAGETTAFAANQLTFARVAQARQAREAPLRRVFEQRGIPYPAPEIFLRVFKHERILELWVRSRGDDAFTLLKEYPVCALPGQLGPKRRMGDVQVPEGFYFIDEFNPRSAFHLSLRVNYPNLADRMRREALALGGDIFIHGGCATVGCVPIENENIEEVYWLAVQAMDAGQKIIPVHIFPTRLDPDRLDWLRRTFDPEPQLLSFWTELADGYAFFEETRRVPWITIAETGRYVVPERPRLADAEPRAEPDSAHPAAAPAGPASRSAAHGAAGRAHTTGPVDSRATRGPVPQPAADEPPALPRGVIRSDSSSPTPDTTRPPTATRITPVQPDSPDSAETRSTKPDSVRPDSVKGEVKPDSVKPDSVKPDSVKPDSVNADPAKPDSVKPDSARPDSARPDSVKPDSVKPDSVKPDSVKPDSVKPDSVNADPAKPDSVKPDSVKPDSVKPDSVKPDSVKPDSVKPDSVKPDSVKPDSVQPDSVTPDSVKPDSVRTDSILPDSLLPRGTIPPDSSGKRPKKPAPRPVPPDSAQPLSPSSSTSRWRSRAARRSSSNSKSKSKSTLKGT